MQAHWSPWSEWTGCDVTCGSGLRQRSRLCNNPPPRSGGTMCEGDDAEIKTCTVECYGIYFILLRITGHNAFI